ncbi:hypothetical protein AAHB44_17935 [Pseudomonas simiae]
MSKRVTHYDDWDGGTEADQDHPDTLFCGTDVGDPEMTPYKDKITCKRCLKILAAGKAERLLEDQKYKSELYDEVWQKARDMGFANVTMALSKLAEQPAPVAVVMPVRLDLPHRDEFESADQYAAAIGEAKIWNACLDELKRLNPSL